MDLGAGATQRNIGKFVLLAPALFLSLFYIGGSRSFTQNTYAVQREPPIIINEVMYDPKGADSGYEWIELKNVSDEPRTLSGWQIQIAGSSFTTKINLSHLTVWPGEIVLIAESEVPNSDMINPLTMQNSGSSSDGVRILNQNDEIIDTLLYGSPNSNLLLDDNSEPTESTAPDVKEGHSLARISSDDTNDCSLDFTETGFPTPGEENIFPPQASISIQDDIFIGQPTLLDGSESTDVDGEIETYDWYITEDDTTLATLHGKTVEYTFEQEGTYTITLEIEDDDDLTHSTSIEIDATQDPENPILTSIFEAKMLESNRTLFIEATITAPLGVLYEKETYAQDDTGGIRIKVPSEIELKYNKTYILTGKTGTVYGEKRIEITSAFPSEKTISIQPIHVAPEEIDESLIGSLISTQILVTQKRDRYLYSDENKFGITPTIYIPKSLEIDIPRDIKGYTIQITGIISQYGTTANGTPKIRIMPVSKDDIVLSSSSVLGLAYTGDPAIISFIPPLLITTYVLSKKKRG